MRTVKEREQVAVEVDSRELGGIRSRSRAHHLSIHRAARRGLELDEQHINVLNFDSAAGCPNQERLSPRVNRPRGQILLRAPLLIAYRAFGIQCGAPTYLIQIG